MKNDSISSFRLDYIDFLKCVGLICIMTAHVNCPFPIFFLRNFDVQLMVIISAMLVGLSYDRRDPRTLREIAAFEGKRILRLALPAWIFLVGALLLQACAGNVYAADYYLQSFLFTSYGMNYVWIILIYIFSALLIPLFAKLPNNVYTPLVILAVYAVYEVLFALGIGAESRWMMTTVYQIIPYGVLSYIGYQYPKMKRKTKAGITLAALLIFAGCAFVYWISAGSFVSTQEAKYPARIYYLSYGVFVSMLLLSLCAKFPIKRMYHNPFVSFVSKHSLWIYLWHILWLWISKRIIPERLWFVELPFLFFLSVLSVYVQNLLISLIEKKKTVPFFKYLKC